MTRTWKWRWVAAALTLAMGAAGSAAAQDDRVAELERKVDVLTQEIEAIKLGGAADTTTGTRARFGFAPAASRVYGVARGVSIGGYGEMLFERFDREREDERLSGRTPQLDYLRQIVYLGYKFDEDLLFNSEIEYEHAGVGGAAAGEVVLEFAYLDWMPRRELGVRAGMVLVPLGWTNELHEPPIFVGARRPDVEQRIIPTTWRANGAGLFGELPAGFSYRAYVTEPLNARRFTAGDAVRGGRQSGSRSRVIKPAFSGRLDYAGLPGLTVGLAGHRGDAWTEAQPATDRLEPVVTLWDAHLRLQWRGLEARGLYARGTLADAAQLSDTLALTGNARLGGRFQGGYAEVSYDVLPLLAPGTRWGLLPYARYERYDTQEDVPGGVENPANERTVVTAGLAVKPHPNVVLKVDRQFRGNQAETETSQWNAALGYLF